MYLSFVSQYLVKPRTVGAISPSSKYLASKMVQDIDFSASSYIVELGAGTGIFTDQLIEKRKKGTVLLVIEYNAAFYKHLKEKYQDVEHCYVVHGSAEKLSFYMEQYHLPYADAVVSGLPFASLPKEMATQILAVVQESLRDKGKFITFQYTNMKKRMIEDFFPKVKVTREFRNLPPAYVFCCMKK
ncbi:class I SAM-dependent methyltransferase [Fictibacillus fluitans]|uniref:rRNA adenine N-6-methyltransferase family protein n=1 Tax=Fictibacillus fluitans TaxID=3058422 RepID=A0ABT8HRF3_9BACL|nr:rRNA adenine N-6-methyltransferase family protein [Fictibacillus sp. NE201]MDN4523321.1 rRNA adenine N-6-methyltransferase family protein [Fictibacillus sp. NE201]